MDLEKVGSFIKTLRKEKGLTQIQLAEKLNVSEKAISKWECGKGFPDSSLMLPLCKELEITANELLSGKKLDESEYSSKAEENLINLSAEHERSTGFLLSLEVVLGYMSSICFFILIFVASFANMADYVRILLIVFGLVQFAVGIYFCLLIEKDAGFYECKHCHHKHIPTYRQILWSMHFGRTRFLKCPKCNKKSWQNKVIK